MCTCKIVFSAKNISNWGDNSTQKRVGELIYDEMGEGV